MTFLTFVVSVSSITRSILPRSAAFQPSRDISRDKHYRHRKMLVLKRSEDKSATCLLGPGECCELGVIDQL